MAQATGVQFLVERLSRCLQSFCSSNSLEKGFQREFYAEM